MIFLSLRFYVKPFLVNLEAKNLPILHYIGGSEIWLLVYFSTLKLHTFNKDQSARTFKIAKMAFLNFYHLWNWFDVKSKWQKNTEISTLCLVLTTLPSFALNRIVGNSEKRNENINICFLLQNNICIDFTFTFRAHFVLKRRRWMSI